ncbi:ras-related protein Rab-26 isoform X2 [Canis lupus baileyi]|uniref:ras-related protein Rab-26 isoform X2 n=1 Tax=Canis lupus familiaris TaxID=9615 RepID=UPI000BAA18EC|nr:ras-related protein Rab-26 isoform X2 [Canis lupus familiaris]XP_025272719.1 ras-related protein Rab-26 isoform X2 [Canis lupus dingo]XP_038396667.1 ras-related protein Rab-26 isoform X2 [Canis lupus familiaris]XP_038525472.1 ras-related protein Rab-26 isoform X2 [Canis lupus familiaris]|eukprot:XP_022275954.1 ras-related protein Rab-26 isoform X2 [Canis lupus familiaris]
MSRKKTPRSKGASAPAASAPLAANGSRPARPIGPPPPARPSLGGGDFYDVAFKVMLVGDSGVGKTCLLVRFKDGAFLAGTFISTVGIDFRNKVLDVDGVKVKLQIWDTAGQERFRSVTHAYYRDAHALLLLYDVTNKASFDNIQGRCGEKREALGQLSPKPLCQVDSAQERVVKRKDGEKLAKVSQGRWVAGGVCPWGCPHQAGSGCLQEYGLPFMETSAKTGLNVDLAFTAIAKKPGLQLRTCPGRVRQDCCPRLGQKASPQIIASCICAARTRAICSQLTCQETLVQTSTGLPSTRP